MNQSKTLTILLGLVLSMNLMAASKTSTLTFTAACNGSGTADDGVTWTVTSDAAESNYDNDKGVHYGTGKKAVSYLTLTSESFDKKITKVVVNCSDANKTAMTSVAVGEKGKEKEFGTSQQETAYNNSAYTFEPTAAQGSDFSGVVVVSMSRTSAKKALYVKSIAVTYEDGDDPDPTEPSLSVSPATIDFGEVYVGGSVDAQDVTATLTNTDYAIATLSGTNATAFEITAGEELTETGTITVQPKATTLATKGTYSATLEVEAEGVDDAKTVTISLNVVEAPAPTGTFAKFTDDLEEGDYVICSETTAMSNEVSSDRMTYATVTTTDDKVVNPDAALIWHIAASGDYWTLYNAEVEKYAASTGAKNKIQLMDAGTDDKALWTTSTSDNKYEFVNKQNTASKVNANLRYNNDYGFACYATSTGSALTLYKKELAPTNEAVTFAAPEGGSLVIMNGATTINTNDKIQNGTVLDVTFGMNTPEAYKDVAIKVTNTTTSADVTSTVYNSETQKITMPRYPITVAVTFTKLYKISLVKEGEGTGSATMNGVTTDIYVDGETKIDLVANAVAPNEFTSWSATDNIAIDKENEAETYAYASGDGTITATFGISSLQPLDAPTLSDPTNITYTGVTLNWQELAHAEAYNVELLLNNETVATDVIIGETTWTPEVALQANTTYTYTVQGVGDGTTYAEENNPKAQSTFTTADYPAVVLTLSENENTTPVNGKLNTPIELPTTSTQACDGKVFMGWSENPIDGEAATATLLGATYTFTDPNTLSATIYAVYAKENQGTTTNWEITSLDKPGSGSGYAPYNGSHTTDGISYTTSQIMVNENKIQFQKNAGYMYNTTPFSGDILSITIADITSNISVYEGSAEITTTPTSGAITLDNGKYTFSKGKKYFHIKMGNATGTSSKITVAFAGESTYSNYCTTCQAAVAAPTFSLEGGNYSEAKTLTLSATEGDIYYTINDGTETKYTTAIALNNRGTYEISAYAKVEDRISETVTKTYTLDWPYESLEELVAANVPSGTMVTVSFSNVVINSFNGTKGVNLNVQCEGKNIQIYNSTAFDTQWKVGGTLSKSNLTCTWSRFVQNSEFRCWELMPANWDGFTYNDPVHFTSIAISGEPTYKDYSDGQQLNPAGLVVTGYYSDHTEQAPHTEVITEGLTWTLPTLKEGAITAQVSVKYTEPVLSNELTSDPYQVTINAVTPAKTLQSIYIAEDSEHKTEFFVGRPFSAEGLKVMAKYNIGEDQAIIPTSVTPPAMTSAGTKQVTVSYTEGGVTAEPITYDITLTYMNLSDLVAATDIEKDDYVYVSFENVKINGFYTNSSGKRYGIYLDVQKSSKDIEIYCNSAEHDATWKQYGTVSATFDNVKWTEYNGTWELTPSSWENVTYTAPNIPVTSMEISPAEVSVGEAKTATLSIVYTPDNATNTGVTWAVTEGSDFASVDADGVVTGNKAGSATITATLTADPTITATRTVTVTETPKCTISYYVKDKVASTQEIAREEEGELTYEPTLVVAGYTFAGWAEEAITEESATATLITKYTPGAEETAKSVYAVFKRVDDSSPTYQQYAKVTSDLTDWAGEYLLVYENEGTAYIWTGVDEVNCNVSATIANNAISSKPDDAASLTIAAMTDGYSIQVKGGDNNGKYINQTKYENGMTISENPSANTLSYDGTNTVIAGSGASGASGDSHVTMQYNTASDQKRFRYYKSSQQAVQLYKYDAGDTLYTSNPPAYTLTYAGIGGYGTSCDLSTKHTCGETITACTPDSRAGYTFKGWTRSDEEAPIAANAEFSMPCDNLTLTATWDSLVTFYVLGENAETQTINADKHVTGYTPAATCTGKQFMGWSTVNQTELIQDPTSLNLFTDFSSKEFTAPTNLYAVYASINGGKITGEKVLVDDISTTKYSLQDKSCKFTNATYNLNENVASSSSTIDNKIYFGFKFDASKLDAHFTTTKIKDLKSISFDYITNGAAISYYVMISADGSEWTKITDNVTLSSNKDNTHTIPAIEVAQQGDYYVKVGVTYRDASKYAIITRMSYTCATRAIWYSDYATSCTMAASATISYNGKYSYTAPTVGETITISNDSHVTEDYQLYSLKINGVTYNVGDSYILAHDVTPEAADIRPIITWTERYNNPAQWTQTTTPADGKLVLPATQPASFAPGLYEFDGWTAETFSTDTKTDQPTYVTAETDAPVAPTTYYAVYKKANTSGAGYTYRQTAPTKLHTITYHANDDPEAETYVVYTDLSTSTTPTATQAGFAKEGATLVGWTLAPNADEIVYVAPGTGLTGINANCDYYAVWIGSLQMSSAIALTSAPSATVGSASFTLSSTDLGTITALRFAYHDVDNNIWYRTTERSKSEFRLCNTDYSLTNADNNVNIVNPLEFSKEYAIVYMPNSGNKMSHYKLVVELLNKSKVMAADTFDLTGRALPDKFIIATQKDDQWYALQANMTKSGTWAGVQIEVEDGFAFASDTLLYSLRTYNSDKTHVLFQSAYKQGHLWAASGDKTGIKNDAKTISGENDPYAWLLTSENDLLSYTILNKQDKPDHQYLGMNGSNMGMYQLLTPMQFYFLPLGYKEDIVIDSDNTLHDFDNYDLSHADVVVKPNATLTIDQSVTTKNVTVETGGKLNITGGTLTVDNLHLEGGWNEGHTLYDVPNVYIAPEASLAKKIDVVNLDIRVDKTNYYPFAVPFPVPVSSIDYVDPVLSAASIYGTHYVIKTYNGALRAENGMDKENNWVKVSEEATLQPGVGYILTAVTPAGYDSRIRFPMTFTNAWTTNGEQGKVEEMTKNQSTLCQFESDIHSCHSGWNMVAVPFMSAYGNGENTTLAGVNYVTIPTYDFSEYKQVEVAETILRPEWSFFIQTGSEQKITFLTEQERLLPTPLSAPQRVNEAPEYAVAVRLSSATNSDKTTLKISNRYTTAYEIGADLEKMFGSGYTLATYTIVGGTRLAYNALSETEAHMLIPVGYRAPEAGTYTFALDITDEMAAQFERIDLIDYETGELTNLMTGTYTFTTERTQSDERFAINATIRKVPTDLDDGVPDRNDGVQKVIYDDHLYIIDHNKVYDGTGSLITIKK